MIIMTRFAHSSWRTKTLSITVALTLVGCSKSFDTLLPDRRPDYRKSTISQPLEIPPDLTASTIDDTLVVPEIGPAGSAALSAYTQERGASAARRPTAVLPPQPGITVQQDGNQRWLVIAAPADQVWPKIREFWTSNGFALKRDDSTIGIMETDWVENRADIPQDGVRAILKQYLDVLYSAPTRDKFRTRLERSTDGKNTEVYLTHYGVEEVAVGGTSASATNTYLWQRRPSSPELEAEMLSRLMVYLGASEKRAEARQAKAGVTPVGPRTRLVEEGGENRLLINEDYSKSWRLVGLALDSSNYAVEEQNRSQGLYMVEYRDPEQENQESRDEGWLSKLAFWRSKKTEAPPVGARYQVRLAGQGAQTVVVVRDSNNQPDSSVGAKQVLDVLQKVIR
ncbi:MAG: outer membrane protein assembly factor BamC [Gammaproteobacteria bacterium]|nr:outer membrane protein assembly factor BamC [Gammaproteobacteria bacterium]